MDFMGINDISPKTKILGIPMVIAFLTVALVTVSCDFPHGMDNGKGRLIMLISGVDQSEGVQAARSVLPNNMLGTLKYKLEFTRDSGDSGPITIPEVNGGTYSINLAQGAWTIYAEAFDSSDRLVGATGGPVPVNIVADQRNYVTIQMFVDHDYEAGLTEIYIHNEEELRRIGTDFAIDGTKSFYLENDITLTQPWPPIGTDTTRFKAVFDGQGHTITMNNAVFDPAALGGTYLGFFGYTENAVVKDVTLAYPSGGTIALTGAGYYVYFGGAAGRADRSEFIGVTLTGALNVSSLAAAAFSIGGITGANYDGSIVASHVKGSVSGISPGTTCAGGIAGEMQSAGGPAPSITESSFTGTAGAESDGSMAYAGGILGQAYTGSVERCYAAGNVEAKGHSVYSGGIAGYYSSNPGPITNSYAYTNTVADGCGNSYAGGIAGSSYGGIILNCYVAGTVKAIQNDNAHAGGISGEHGNSGQLNNSMVLLDALDGGGMNAYTLFGTENVGYGSNSGNQVWDAITVIQWGSAYKNGTTNPLSNYTPDSGKDIVSFTAAPGFKNSAGQAAYTGAGWAFTGTVVWKWLSPYEYPVLEWQTAAPDISVLGAGFGIIWP
jgi:hypothetical protein